MTQPEPTLIGGRYELGELLGRGGMAEVRKGKDLRLGRTVAVKRLRTDLASDATFQARFRREAQSSASLNHPSIVSTYDTGEEMATDGSGVAQPYIVMECVEGRTLRDILREGRKILPERALEITAGVLSALDYSHRAGIIHRDIKPGNVMLTPSGDVKVMDFGIARAISDASSTMTQTAAVVGTAQYLSPEQARGETVDSRSDVYSTGCLLYELLTGRPPFVGDSPVAVAYQHVREQASPPSDLDDQLDPEIDAIVMKSLAKRVEDRYQSAAAMKADIERYLAGHPIQAPAVVPPPRRRSTSRRSRRRDATIDHGRRPAAQPPRDEPSRSRAGWWVLAGILVVALLAGGAYVLNGDALRRRARAQGGAQRRRPDRGRGAPQDRRRRLPGRPGHPRDLRHRRPPTRSSSRTPTATSSPTPAARSTSCSPSASPRSRSPSSSARCARRRGPRCSPQRPQGALPGGGLRRAALPGPQHRPGPPAPSVAEGTTITDRLLRRPREGPGRARAEAGRRPSGRSARPASSPTYAPTPPRPSPRARSSTRSRPAAPPTRAAP